VFADLKIDIVGFLENINYKPAKQEKEEEIP
jgi:hypothetical protein